MSAGFRHHRNDFGAQPVRDKCQIGVRHTTQIGKKVNAVKGGRMGPPHRVSPVKRDAALAAHGTRFLFFTGREPGREYAQSSGRIWTQTRDMSGDLHRPAQDWLRRQYQRRRDRQLRGIW